MAAVTYGFPKLVDYLLEWNADVNLVCQKEPHPTPLIMAASSFFIEDRPALIGRLIQSGADVEAQDARGQTALMATMTLGEGYRDALLALIEFGADVGARDHDGNTALMHAIQGGYNELARILRSEEAERDGLEEIALLEACEQSNLDAVTDLILAGADVNYRCGWTPLMVAASKGSIDIVDMLLKVGADPDRGASEEHGEPYTPLLLAAHRGHLEVVERLIEAGVDLEVRIDDVGGALDYALVGRHEARERCDEGETFDQDGHWSRLVSLLESKTCVRQDRKRTGERAATRIVA
jgi:ankyrin repeat protein